MYLPVLVMFAVLHVGYTKNAKPCKLRLRLHSLTTEMIFPDDFLSPKQLQNMGNNPNCFLTIKAPEFIGFHKIGLTISHAGISAPDSGRTAPGLSDDAESSNGKEQITQQQTTTTPDPRLLAITVKDADNVTISAWDAQNTLRTLKQENVELERMDEMLTQVKKMLVFIEDTADKEATAGPHHRQRRFLSLFSAAKFFTDIDAITNASRSLLCHCGQIVNFNLLTLHYVQLLTQTLAVAMQPLLAVGIKDKVKEKEHYVDNSTRDTKARRLIVVQRMTIITEQLVIAEVPVPPEPSCPPVIEPFDPVATLPSSIKQNSTTAIEQNGTTVIEQNGTTTIVQTGSGGVTRGSRQTDWMAAASVNATATTSVTGSPSRTMSLPSMSREKGAPSTATIAATGSPSRTVSLPTMSREKGAPSTATGTASTPVRTNSVATKTTITARTHRATPSPTTTDKTATTPITSHKPTTPTTTHIFTTFPKATHTTTIPTTIHKPTTPATTHKTTSIPKTTHKRTTTPTTARTTNPPTTTTHTTTIPTTIHKPTISVTTHKTTSIPTTIHTTTIPTTTHTTTIPTTTRPTTIPTTTHTTTTPTTTHSTKSPITTDTTTIPTAVQTTTTPTATQTSTIPTNSGTTTTKTTTHTMDTPTTTYATAATTTSYMTTTPRTTHMTATLTTTHTTDTPTTTHTTATPTTTHITDKPTTTQRTDAPTTTHTTDIPTTTYTTDTPTTTHTTDPPTAGTLPPDECDQDCEDPLPAPKPMITHSSLSVMIIIHTIVVPVVVGSSVTKVDCCQASEEDESACMERNRESAPPDFPQETNQKQASMFQHGPSSPDTMEAMGNNLPTDHMSPPWMFPPGSRNPAEESNPCNETHECGGEPTRPWMFQGLGNMAAMNPFSPVLLQPLMTMQNLNMAPLGQMTDDEGGQFSTFPRVPPWAFSAPCHENTAKSESGAPEQPVPEAPPTFQYDPRIHGPINMANLGSLPNNAIPISLHGFDSQGSEDATNTGTGTQQQEFGHELPPSMFHGNNIQFPGHLGKVPVFQHAFKPQREENAANPRPEQAGFSQPVPPNMFYFGGNTQFPQRTANFEAFPFGQVPVVPSSFESQNNENTGTSGTEQPRASQNVPL